MPPTAMKMDEDQGCEKWSDMGGGSTFCLKHNWNEVGYSAVGSKFSH